MDLPRHGPAKPLRGAARTLHVLVNDRRDYLVGIALLLVVVLLWSLGNFVTQEILQGGYEKPFFVTWLKISAFTFYLIPLGLKRLFGTRHEQSRGEYERLIADPPPRVHTTGDDTDLAYTKEELPPLTTEETLRLAAICCLLWFATIWASIACLDYTSVTSTTILASINSFITLGIGRLLKVESLSVTKVVAVAISFSGILLVSLSDSAQALSPEGTSVTSDGGEYSNPLLGDFLALLSATIVAFYITLLKVKVRQESRINMHLFFGFIGVFSVLFLWPIGLILHCTGVEPFELPSGGRTIAGLLVNMFVTVSGDFICAYATLKTTPLVATVSLSLLIPVAVVGDSLLGRTVGAISLLGAFLVLGSFIIIGLEGSKNDKVLEEEAVAEEDQARIPPRLSLEVEGHLASAGNADSA